MVARGALVFVEPDPSETYIGSEQQGQRPAVVVSTNFQVKYDDIVTIVPITSSPMNGDFYPKVKCTPTGLNRDGYALPEQIRVASKSRITRRIGKLPSSAMDKLEESLRKWLGL